MTFLAPEDPGETEPEANPQHADHDDEDTPLAVVGGGGGADEDVTVLPPGSVTSFVKDRLLGRLGEAEDEAMLGDGDGPFGLAVTSQTSLLIEYRDEQADKSLRVELAGEVNSDDFSEALVAFGAMAREMLGVGSW